MAGFSTRRNESPAFLCVLLIGKRVGDDRIARRGIVETSARRHHDHILLAVLSLIGHRHNVGSGLKLGLPEQFAGSRVESMETLIAGRADEEKWFREAGLKVIRAGRPGEAGAVPWAEVEVGKR